MIKEKFRHGELINGDSLEYLKSIPDHSIDMVLTDPPYFYKEDIKRGKQKLTDDMSDIRKSIVKNHNNMFDIVSGIDYDAYFKEWERVLKDMNLAVYCNSEQLVDYITLANGGGGYKFKVLILHKLNPTPYKHAFVSDVEFCLYIYDPKKPFKNYGKDRDSLVFDYLTGGKNNVVWHPTVKPIEHIKWLINKFTQENDVILDCFSGSGTTAKAAAIENRRFIAIELNETYFKKSIPRIRESDNLISFDFGDD